MTVKYSCVMDQHPRFAQQALVWASSLLVYGGQAPDSLVIHAVGECASECRRVFDNWGIDIRIVQRFDERHAHSNKLTQLESTALHSADYVVLYDCDTAFCVDISPWIRGDCVRARIASWHGLPPARWQKVFQRAGLKLPAARVKPLRRGEETLPSYCSGCYIIPQPVFQKLREAWPRWDRWLLDRPGLIQPFGVFADQISFAMSCEELGLSVDYFPVELNLDTTHLPRGMHRKTEVHPLVLHYHRLDAKGFLRLTQVPSIDREIRKINDLIRVAKRVNFNKPSLLLLGGRQRASAVKKGGVGVADALGTSSQPQRFEYTGGWVRPAPELAAEEEQISAFPRTPRVQRPTSEPDVPVKPTERRIMSEISDSASSRELPVNKKEAIDAINRHYDQRMFSPNVRGHYDFHNYGYWLPNTRTRRTACENLMEELLSFIPRKEGTILDVACGKGATTRHLLKYYAPEQVTGINISKKQLQRCRVNAPGCKFLMMDATALTFGDNCFDNVICVEAA